MEREAATLKVNEGKAGEELPSYSKGIVNQETLLL
jgi:hypothetical protein